MEQELLNMSMELCRDPMVAVRDGLLAGFNRAAAKALPELWQGGRAEGLLPPALLDCPPGHAVSLARLGETAYSVRCRECGALRLYVASPLEEQSDRGFLSDGVLNRLLSGVCNLNVAVGQLDAAKDEPFQTQTRAILNRSCHALTRQLGDLRTAVGLQERTLPVQPQEMELVDYCRALCQVVRACTEDLGTALRFETEEAELYAGLDPALLERMLLNLLSNSFAHTPAGGTVRLRLEQRNGAVLLTVDDNGEGIAPEVLERVFHRYAVRATPEDFRPAATGGLGLYIVSGLARLMQGTLVIESRPGEGTTVRLSLPRHGDVSQLACSVDTGAPTEDAVRLAFAELLPLERFADSELR